jgi:signal transduction histidine kinase
MFVTTKASGEGSGLGLAISQEIVKAHGGTLELSNAPGKGACARILLPAAKETQIEAGTVKSHDSNDSYRR